jgi:hypothetical protein
MVQNGSAQIIESLAAIFPERIKTKKRLQKIALDDANYRCGGDKQAEM